MKLYLLITFLFSGNLWASTFLDLNPNSKFKYNSCFEYALSDKDCDEEFRGLELQVCEVCRENRSCLFTFPNNRHRSMCDAYLGNKSCLRAFESGSNHRGWCKVLKENKSCEVFKGWVVKRQCLHGEYPQEHLFWIK